MRRHVVKVILVALGLIAAIACAMPFERSFAASPSYNLHGMAIGGALVVWFILSVTFVLLDIWLSAAMPSQVLRGLFCFFASPLLIGAILGVIVGVLS